MEKSHGMMPAESDIQVKPEFRIKKSEIEPHKAPVISDEDLDRISSLEVDDEDLDYLGRLARRDDPRLGEILAVLRDRDITGELPVENDTFAYKRNLAESKHLQLEVFKLMAKGPIDTNDPQKMESLKQISRLFVLEGRKAEWLEEDYFPVVFGDAVQVAQAEVAQFLIKQFNSHDLAELRDPTRAQVRLRDELHYVSTTGLAGSAGLYERLHDRIDIKIPSHYTRKDEWKVYLVSVHELLHSVSYMGNQRLGLHDSTETGADMVALNESVTDMLTFIIANDHIEMGKTPLEGESNKRIAIPDMGYGGLLIILKQVLSKIPLQMFTDAMLSQEGLIKLKDEFEKVYGEPDSLTNFAKKMHEVYA